ncbi:MAG: molecular chaperone DnaJ [Clostridia bacterium]|nr:molecular chaperone DnaJ [Clostridia bacterium]
MTYKFFKNVDTIEELYAQYKKLAMKHHPDHGGRLEDMQQINSEYDDLKRKVGNIHKSASGETYKSEDNRADTPDRFKDIINAVINFDIDLELCGCWLWAFNAYNYKEQLKNLGFFYCSKKRAWAWTDEPTKRKSQRMSLDEIRETYGSEVIKTRKDDTKKIQAVN